jgi:hypothetical protein
MADLDEARQALSEAVSGSGLACLPYPPENPSPPLAFVDDISVDFTGGAFGTGYFCLPGSATATIVTLAQRHDRTASMQFLEGKMPAILSALSAIPGLRILAAGSGQMNVGGQDLPALTYTVSFLT